SGGGMGWGEGNVSLDGLKFAVGKWNGTDLRIQIVHAGYNRVGFVNVIPDNGMFNKIASEWTLSPSGRYLVIHYSSKVPTGTPNLGGRSEAMRVFLVDTTNTSHFGHLQPAHYPCRNYGTGNTGENIGIYNRVAAYSTAPTDTVKGDTTGYGANRSIGGWITSYSHPDVAQDPDSAN